MSMNPYEVLGVSANAKSDEIYKAFCNRTCDPKIFDEQNPEEKKKEINLAYKTLSDPEKRKIYDDYGVLDDVISEIASVDLKRLVGAVSEQIVDPTELGTYDLVERMRRAVRANKDQVEKGLAYLEEKLHKMALVREHFERRIKKKTDKEIPDFFFSPIDEIIENTKLHRKKSKNTLLVVSRIIEFLDDHDYEFTPLPEPETPPLANDNSDSATIN